jgi:hypothetical protein
VACDSDGPQPEPVDLRPVGSAYLQAGGIRHLGACLDTLYPSPESFGPQLRDDIARDFSDFASGPNGWTDDTVDANLPKDASVDARDGLDLWVKAVYTNAMSTDNREFTVHAVLPAVSGLTAAMPSLDSPQWTSWQRDRATMISQWKQAYRDASQARNTLGTMPFPPYHQTLSGISGCMSTLLQLVPHDGKRSFLIATDCDEPQAPQLQGDFQNDPLTIIQTCPSGDSAVCDQFYNQFVGEMQRLHVGKVTRIRPEMADEAIQTWVDTGDA